MKRQRARVDAFASMSRLVWISAAVSIAMAVVVPVANADFGISSFDGEVLQSDGAAASQAGSHPHSGSTTIVLNQHAVDFGGFPLQAPDGPVREFEVELPPGLVGNPTVVEECPGYRLIDKSCPTDSQVGRAEIGTSIFTNPVPLWNMAPPPGVTAAFGFLFSDTVKVMLFARPRSDGDYGITITAPEISQALPILWTKVTLWGVPSDPVHEPLRLNGPSSLPRRAFLTNPTACTPSGVGLETRLFTRSWGGETDSSSFFSHDVAPNESVQLGPTGCDRVPFDPATAVSVDTTSADAPTGLTFDLSFPQESITNPSAIATAHLKRAEVTLPEGMSVNPAAADGLEACSDAQLGIGTKDSIACPDGSKVGTVEATTPLLKERLQGSVYLRSQASSDPESGDLFRLALHVFNEERGIDVRLPGHVFADRETGRLKTVFDDNPQVPVTSLRVRLKNGPRAPLATPAECGSHEVVTELSSWARPGESVILTDAFTVACPGRSGFAPGFRAGSVSPVGGAFSPLVALVDRPDGQQLLSRVDGVAPKGLVAKLAGVELCPEAVASDGTSGVCPAGSRIGTATVAAGAGSSPFRLQGPVYLTGPYNGGPYGVSVQVPAKAGPFDLGLVKVRAALVVDPETAEVSVISDALPQIVSGVLVRLRSVHLSFDRPRFVINPTSCSEKRIDATMTSTQGAVHKAGSRFQVGDCQALGFRPKMAMRLTGRKQTRTGGHPGLRTVVAQKQGEANIASATVTLPKSVVLDPNNTVDPNLVCGYDESLKADCPASTVIGKAVARTPLLDQPLTGKVHLVQGIKFGPNGNRIRTTPSLLIKLRGQVAINVRARTTVKHNRLVTRIPNVPDAPVSRFDLNINGGKHGILVITRTRKHKINICNSRQTASIQTDAHNAKQADYNTTIKTPCTKTKKAKRSKNRRARR